MRDEKGGEGEGDRERRVGEGVLDEAPGQSGVGGLPTRFDKNSHVDVPLVRQAG
ncbi:hypothetical protein OOK44_38735 [Streptomyces cellulosae]|uniref:hypothetical protein n=1 Tax=Streptomyces TaxID=1883 RepID=UPI0022524A30|nr:hypothetical protein [Streptomyces cellulosae]